MGWGYVRFCDYESSIKRRGCSTHRGLHSYLLPLNVRYWHLADITGCTAHVRFRG